MVMGNAYQPGGTLLFDHIHRREARSEAIEKYPSNVLQCHEDFTSAIAQSMQAKVEIVYGQKVQSRLLQTQAIWVLPLWGNFEGLILFLALEKGYSNKDPRFQLRRIMLMAGHPQHIFYCARNSDTTLHQEKIMEAATLMTNNAVPWVDGYFTQKIWLCIIPGILEKQEIKAFGEVLRRAQKMPPANISEGSYGVDIQTRIIVPKSFTMTVLLVCLKQGRGTSIFNTNLTATKHWENISHLLKKLYLTGSPLTFG